MLNNVERFIQENNLLDKKRRYLVALSGGADSVSLLLILVQLGYQVHAAHCNFRLRGAESDRDEQFCKALCGRHNIPLHLAHFDTLNYASLKKISIEMAARELRYAYFEQLRSDLLAEGICVGHHQEDSVETILLNLMRGTGLRGLTGIRPKNGHILRPLLGISRKEIEEYLQKEGETYITDSSNLEDNVMRNKLRLNIIPMLQQMNPSFNQSVAQMSKHLSEAEKVVDWAVQDALKRADVRLEGLKEGQEVHLPGTLFQQFPSPEYMFFHLFSPLGFYANQLKEMTVALGQGRGQLWQSEQYEVTATQESFILRGRKPEKQFEKKLPETGNYVLSDGLTIKLAYVNDPSTITPDRLKADPWTAYMDADEANFPLLVRHTEQGDRFQPFGMKGKKLVSDFLTDLKQHRFQKQEQLVVEDATGEIVWLAGLRISEKARVHSQTNKVLTIKIIKK